MKFFKRQHAVGVCVACAALLLILPASYLSPVKYKMLAMSTGLQAVAYKAESWLHSLVASDSDSISSVNGDAFLQLERDYQAELVRSEELRSQLAAMTELGSVIEKDLDSFVPIQARIRSQYDLSQVAQVLMINVGRSLGVLPGQAVVSGSAIVGRIEWAGENSSRVRLLTDINFRADVCGAQSYARGVLVGRGTQSLGLNFVSIDQGMLADELLITSGLDMIFPKGLLVGRIDRVDDADQNKVLEFDISPAVNVRRLNFVTVLRPIE